MHISLLDKVRAEFVNTVEKQIIDREERIKVLQATFDTVYADLNKSYQANLEKLNKIYKTVMDPEVQTVNELRAMLDWGNTDADSRAT